MDGRKMARGRKPIPAHLKLVTGKGAKMNVDTKPPVAPAGFPDPPDTLSSRARKQWPNVVATLSKMGVIAPSDWMAVEQLCEARADWFDARDAIEEQGAVFTSMTGVIKANPAVAMRNDAARRIASLMAEFGLTPSSRTKVPQADKAPDENDPSAKYFGD
jgi:P27 family predicted phage terminase small subunit